MSEWGHDGAYLVFCMRGWFHIHQWTLPENLAWIHKELAVLAHFYKKPVKGVNLPSAPCSKS
jgi:hypothetical protein